MSQPAWSMAAAPPPLAWANAPEDEDDVLPIGAIYQSALDVDPGLPKPDGFGYGTWQRWGHGRVVIGVDENEAGFEEAETEGGSATVTPAGTVSQPTFTGSALGTHSHGAGTLAASAHSGAAVGDHASHTHSYSEIVQHTHTVSITDPQHSHTTVAHSHTIPVGATDDTAAPFDRADAGTNASGANATTATGTASPNTNVASTGITASTANPAGSVASGTTAGPSATLSHSVTQPADHTMSGSTQAVSAGTPSGTVSQPTFTGQAQTVRMPFITAYLWKRVA